MSCGDKSRRLTFWWGSDECGFLSMASFPPGPTLTNPDRALLKAAGIGIEIKRVTIQGVPPFR